MKKILVLAHDYWHHKDTVEPITEYLKQSDYEIIFTTNPEELKTCHPDVLVSFKDPVENNQIPTPAWSDEAWTKDGMEKIKSGMGFVGVHAALADLPREHPLAREVIRATFITHPAVCEVTFRPDKKHEILDGVQEFVICEKDEHYQMQLYEECPTAVIGSTVSEHGEQPALWAHELGQGRIYCFTPGHTTKILISEDYVRIVKNAIKWCLKDK